MMTRVTAPGLPSSPKILFDPKAGRAKVSLRHPTWRGTERALYATELLVWVARIGLAVSLWNRYARHDLVPRLAIVAFFVLLIYPIAAALFRASFRSFIARQLFPTRTTLWVTTDAIAFRSRLYGTPVVIWRRWDSRPIGVRFTVEADHAAQQYSSDVGFGRKLPKDHLDGSTMLTMVLTTVDPNAAAACGRHDASMRAIPITEIDGGLATKVTMAYTHALTLTTPNQEPTEAKPGVGIDIDAV